MPLIQARYKGLIEIKYLELKDEASYKLLLGLEELYQNKTKKTLPIIFLQGKFLSGEAEVRERLEPLIRESITKSRGVKTKAAIAAIDLEKYLYSFAPLAVLIAGLIDGINPCAFTVIVFFVTFLLFQKYRKREIFFSGICFILAIFLTYLLIGLGLWQFLYNLNRFHSLMRTIYITVAGLCFILGMISVYDIFRYRKNAKSEEIFLRLPQGIKFFIQKIIGIHFRKGKGNDSRQGRGMLTVITLALVTGAVVSVLEAVCTGQVYLPVITLVLRMSHLKMRALAYLFLYNAMFIVPLFIIFLLAFFGTGSEAFTQFMQKRMALIKIILAGLFFGLGGILLLRI